MAIRAPDGAKKRSNNFAFQRVFSGWKILLCDGSGGGGFISFKEES